MSTLSSLPPRRGRLEVIAGSMYAGKSSELVRRIRRAEFAARTVQVFTSNLDSRYAGPRALSTHTGDTLPGAAPVGTAREVLTLLRPHVSVVAIDEVQFLDADIVDVCTVLARMGYQVIVAGLTTDFRGHPFGPLPSLMAIADEITLLRAVCVVCGDDAIRTQRLVNGAPAHATASLIQIGGTESYEARCRHCHSVPTLGAPAT